MTRQIKLQTWFFRRFQNSPKKSHSIAKWIFILFVELVFLGNKEKERKKERTKTNRWNNSIQRRAVEYTVYRLKSLRKRFEGTRVRSRCLADVVEQLCSIDPFSDSVITCKYLPIFRNDKQPTSAAIFDELCPRFPAIYTFCTERYIAHVVLKLR